MICQTARAPLEVPEDDSHRASKFVVNSMPNFNYDGILTQLETNVKFCVHLTLTKKSEEIRRNRVPTFVLPVHC